MTQLRFFIRVRQAPLLYMFYIQIFVQIIECVRTFALLSYSTSTLYELEYSVLVLRTGVRYSDYCTVCSTLSTMMYVHKYWCSTRLS
jgi:hypothetical protein